MIYRVYDGLCPFSTGRDIAWRYPAADASSLKLSARSVRRRLVLARIANENVEVHRLKSPIPTNRECIS
jgi:hypothetical protein